MSDELTELMRSAYKGYAEYGVEGSEGARAMREGLARIEALTAERDALHTAIVAALERLDASMFTNAEHQQAKDILRNARKATP